MRWIINDGLRSQLPFSEVNISETLYEFEGPKIFTATSHGLLTLCMRLRRTRMAKGIWLFRLKQQLWKS